MLLKHEIVNASVYEVPTKTTQFKVIFSNIIINQFIVW